MGGRTIGQVIDRVGYKDVSGKKHFLHYPEEAIAFTIDALYAMQRAGAVFVDVLDTDKGIHYRTTIQNYFEHGERFNYGWGDQIKLALPNFTQSRDPEYMGHTDSEPQAYSDSDMSDVKPLNYKSHATVGIVYNGVKVDSVKQLDLFGDGE